MRGAENRTGQRSDVDMPTTVGRPRRRRVKEIINDYAFMVALAAAQTLFLFVTLRGAITFDIPVLHAVAPFVPLAGTLLKIALSARRHRAGGVKNK